MSSAQCSGRRTQSVTDRPRRARITASAVPKAPAPRTVISVIARPLVALDRLLLVATVEMLDPQPARFDAFDAAQIHIDLIRIGTRDVERRHAASPTEVMPRHAGIEAINRELLPGRQQSKALARDDPVDITLLRADRAVAYDRAFDWSTHFEGDRPAVASPAIKPRRLVHSATLSQARAPRKCPGTTKTVSVCATRMTILDALGTNDGSQRHAGTGRVPRPRARLARTQQAHRYRRPRLRPRHR